MVTGRSAAYDRPSGAAAPSMLAVCAALLQLRGQPLAGGLPSGGAAVPLERASGGDTPVLTLRSARGSLRLLFDTGASSSMVIPAAAKRLGLVSRVLPPSALGLAGGGSGCKALRPGRTALPTLRVESPGGRLEIRAAEALVLPVAALPPGIDGVLGAPLWSRLPVRIDPRRQLLRLGQGATTPEPGAPTPLTLPLRWFRGVPLLQLTTAAGPVAALADTGAEGLFLAPGLAAQLRPLGPAEPLRLVGFCGEQAVVRRRFDGFSLGEPATAGGEELEAIVAANSIYRALGVEAIAGQALLRERVQLWRLDLQPPRLSLW